MVMLPAAKADACKQTRSHFVRAWVLFSFVPLNMAITRVIPSLAKS
jgi:hypothetical protein